MPVEDLRRHEELLKKRWEEERGRRLRARSSEAAAKARVAEVEADAALFEVRQALKRKGRAAR